MVKISAVLISNRLQKNSTVSQILVLVTDHREQRKRIQEELFYACGITEALRYVRETNYSLLLYTLDKDINIHLEKSFFKKTSEYVSL